MAELRIQFIARKSLDTGKWGVYDTFLGSWPAARPGLGRIKQDTTQQEAEAEAARLNTITRSDT
jgi:hypothetical protein